MAATKRATWIEGITKSNRILRDLSEIFTSANRDDMGISKAENWELVYPRPFEEFSVVRGTLLQDGTETRHYTPVIDRVETIELYDGIDATLEFEDIVESTLLVRSEDLSKTYEKGTDYTYDSATRSISRLSSGSIAASARLAVNYGTKVAQILESVPVLVEKILKEPNPDRPIDPAEYTIDYINNRIIFTVAPPADAAYFALSFTDITGAWSRNPQEKLQLEMDLLDPTGHTYKLPAVAKQIGELNAVDSSGTNVHEFIAAQSTTGTTGLSVTGSGIVYEITHDSTSGPTTASIKFISGAPTLGDNQQLLLRAYEYNDFVTKSSWTQKDFVLIKDVSLGDDTYRVIGLAQGLHITLGTRIVVHTTFDAPVFYKHLSSLHAGFETLQETAYTVQYGKADGSEDPRIVAFLDIDEDLIMTFYARGVDDLKNGIDRIENRVVLKTTTQPEQVFETMIENSYGDADLAETLTMYVEFTKPKRLVNPETGLERYTDWKGVITETQLNNHYIEARMFDKWDDANQEPLKSTYNAKGEVITKGAMVSDWSKYSWFKDWREYMVDELDSDPGTSNVADGIIFQEIQVDGMDEEFPVQFWISTNNNRTAMVLMGDPTLDQDNFLTSFAYFGRIHPFYDKECVVKRDESGTMLLDANGNPIIEEKRTYFQNDVAGNFALTAGSSTLPVRVGAAPVGTPFVTSTQLAVDEAGDHIVGRLYDYTAYAYAVTYLTESGESKPTQLNNLDARLIINIGENGGAALVPTTGSAIRLNFTIPNEATGYRIYRYHQTSATSLGSGSTIHSNYKLVTSVTKYEGTRLVEFIDDGSLLPIEEDVYDVATDSYIYNLLNTTSHAYYNRVAPLVSTSRAFEAVTRDTFTGAILDVKFPDKWGVNTATGVSDIMMFATRSGLKYQRHVASFITTEEFMRKEKSGQSRWTGKFHLSPVYVEHSYDKQRGWLDGVMAVDDSGIEHLDDLIVDKDTPNEEVYKFFRINAPYSFFNNSANYAYGLAIIKSSLRW